MNLPSHYLSSSGIESCDTVNKLEARNLLTVKNHKSVMSTCQFSNPFLKDL